VSALDKIRGALAPEAGKALFGLCNTFQIREDDDRLVIMAAAAMLIARLEEVTSRFDASSDVLGRSPELVSTAITGGFTGIDERITESVERAVAVTLDMVTTEVRSLVRDLVVAEMTTAAMVRTQAINQEAEALVRKVQEMGVPAGATSVAMAAEPWWHKLVWGLVGGCVVLLGMLVVLHVRR